MDRAPSARLSSLLENDILGHGASNAVLVAWSGEAMGEC